MKRFFLAVVVAVCFTMSAGVAQAAFIYDVTLPGSVSLLGSNLFQVNTDNAVNADLAQILENQPTEFNWFGFQKSFTDQNPIDIILHASNTQGTTEYLVVELVQNSVGLPWDGYTLELGIGTGSEFRSLSELGADGVGLDFDTPDLDPAVQFLFLDDQSPIFNSIVNNPDSVLFSNGTYPADPGELSLLAYSIDVPDGGEAGYSFTLRQNPNVVPEPATMMLLGTGLLGAAGIRRKKRA